MNTSCHIEGILPKGPYLSCVSMAGRALLAGYHRYDSVFCTTTSFDNRLYLLISATLKNSVMYLFHRKFSAMAVLVLFSINKDVTMQINGRRWSYGHTIYVLKYIFTSAERRRLCFHLCWCVCLFVCE